MLGIICTCTATYPLVDPVLRSAKTLRQDLSKILARALDGCPPEQFFGISALNIGPEFIQLMGAVVVLDAICRRLGASSRDKYDLRKIQPRSPFLPFKSGALPRSRLVDVTQTSSTPSTSSCRVWWRPTTCSTATRRPRGEV